MDDYLPLLVTFVLAVVFVLGSIVTSRMLGPSRPTVPKSAPYESGIVPTRMLPDRFPVRFYLVAMIFIIFDIEIIFLFPWATVYRSLGTYGLLVLANFTVPFIIVFVWMVSHGALDWGPVRRGRREVPADDARLGTRTITSTVRRVGMDGRFPLDASLPKEEVA
ncbi:MAG TPA: NADH-quinone oxidoreductase subunit A [Acidimicrobiales bacterium]|jgi:NADH-quinone oxidoreductase subunit A